MLTTANLLAEQGWRVTAVACAVEDLARYTGVDRSLDEHVHPGVEVVRVPFDLGPAETDLRRYSRLRARAPGVWDAWQAWRKRRLFPENVYYTWRRPLEKAVERIHRERPADLVVVSAGPFVVFSAAMHLHQKHGVPYVVDHRDAWSLQQFTGERIHSADSDAGKVERRVLSHARRIWFVNNPIRTWYEEAFPEIVGRTRVVLNGFDAVAVQGVLPPRRPAEDETVGFGFLGTVTISVPLDEFLAGWRVFASRQEHPVSRARFYGYLGYYANPTWKLQNAIEKAADLGVSYEGPVDKVDVHRIYSEMDVLLLIFGGNRYITSGKVFEYMATGRPIVSVHGPDNVVREVLEDYPLWFPSRSLAPDDVADALERAYEAVVSGAASDTSTWQECIKHAEVYDRSRQISPAVTELREVLGR